MSDDGFSDCFEEPNMEIQIKTLMGTSFDIKVSSNDTIGDIKKKIYRVEGIPIYQQNLIFQSRELNDTYRLCDAGIKNGSILTLVASMRGGPISTRRLSVACEHHVILKELKELLENTRDEIGDKLAPGSKVSVLVFKEGDMINLLRVIENEDGSYSPYSEKPISPPSKPSRKETRSNIFERLVEDNDMSAKISSLRKRMEDVSLRRQTSRWNRSKEQGAGASSQEPPHLPQPIGEKNAISFKFLTECAGDLLDNVDLRVFENKDEGNHSETEEIALKDKHRSKPKSESKGLYMKKARSPPEGASAPPRNRLQLTRLVLETERPKSTPELEENAQDLWEIHESASERLKHSATCKVGLLKRRPGLDYGSFDPGNASKPDLANYCNNSEFEVCSSGNFYHPMPQFVSSPSAIPPQYAPKEHYYFRNNTRSPLYGRKSKQEAELVGVDESKDSSSTGKTDNYAGFLSECSTSSIQRLKNDCVESGGDSLFSNAASDSSVNVDDLYGYYNLGCSTSDFLGEQPALDPMTMSKKKKSIQNAPVSALPPVIKKKARCSECNKRLNITNIYDCRCGRIFCSQHRYSEVHRCSYDYKTEGRRILQQQNPLVQAEKVNKI